jgi:3-dehydroquinate synthetase
MTLQNLNLPTRLTEIDENGKLVFQPDFDENDILEASKNDKKRNGNKIRFILLSGIGNGIMMDDVSDEEILLASKSIL